MRRPAQWFLRGAAITLEGYLLVRYSQIGGEFHFWLHLLVGAIVGVAAITAVALVRNQPPRPIGGPVLAGHLWSGSPDLLFIGLGLLHYRWMDVFALHISVHFIPAPLLTLLAVLAGTLAAWALAGLGSRRTATGALVGSAVVLLGAFAVRAPIPTTIQDIRATPEIALWCPLVDAEAWS